MHIRLMSMQPKLIFVYNANKDILSKTLDFAHKLLQPSTYRCELCALTHGNFSERQAWRKFREESKVEMEFMYAGELKNRLNFVAGEFPLVLINRGNDWEIALSKKDFEELRKLEDLIVRIQTLTSS